MKPRFVSRFDMLPIRWRLAVTSAILTFAILLLFAAGICIATSRICSKKFHRDSIRATC